MATVLSAFMGGLAIGSLIFGRMVDKVKSPLRLFMLLEFGIGLFAILFPFTFRGLINLYTPIIQKFGLSSYSGQIVKFLFSFVYLLIPTILMGGTLPVIFKFFVRQLGNLGWHVSNLFAINNLGAVTGCFFAGFILIKTFGLTTSLHIAACINFINAVAVFIIFKSISGQTVVAGNSDNATNTSDESNKLPKPLLRLVLWVFAIEGFTTLAFEVI